MLQHIITIQELIVKMQAINCPLCNRSNSIPLINIFNEMAQAEFSLVECDCTFVYLNPRPYSEDMGKYYITEDYHPHSKGKGLLFFFYKIARKITYYWKFRAIKKYLNKNITHLDYGSGDGSFSDYLNFKKNTTSTSYDPYYQDMKSFNSLKEKYNIITLWHVLEHIYDLDEFWIEIDRLLDVDGFIFIAVPNFDSFEKKYFSKDWAAYDLPKHLYHFNNKTLNELLDQKGFKVLERKRMLLDTLYISILSSKEKNIWRKVKATLLGLIFMFKVLFKGPIYSSSLFYVCQRKK